LSGYVVSGKARALQSTAEFFGVEAELAARAAHQRDGAGQRNVRHRGDDLGELVELAGWRCTECDATKTTAKVLADPPP
jgi:hypothetical protein